VSSALRSAHTVPVLEPSPSPSPSPLTSSSPPKLRARDLHPPLHPSASSPAPSQAQGAVSAFPLSGFCSPRGSPLRIHPTDEEHRLPENGGPNLHPHTCTRTNLLTQRSPPPQQCSASQLRSKRRGWWYGASHRTQRGGWREAEVGTAVADGRWRRPVTSIHPGPSDVIPNRHSIEPRHMLCVSSPARCMDACVMEARSHEVADRWIPAASGRLRHEVECSSPHLGTRSPWDGSRRPERSTRSIGGGRRPMPVHRCNTWLHMAIHSRHVFACTSCIYA
jgi:hypothetical protein